MATYHLIFFCSFLPFTGVTPSQLEGKFKKKEGQSDDIVKSDLLLSLHLLHGLLGTCATIQRESKEANRAY